MSLLLEQFEHLLTTPEAVDALNAQILQWAVQGKLVPQNPDDEPASVLLRNIDAKRLHLVNPGEPNKNKALPLVGVKDFPYSIPETWEWVRLGNIALYGISEKANPSKLDASIWVLDLEDIEKGTSRLLERIRYKDRPFRSSKNWFRKGDILYGKLRPYLDKVLVADEDGVCTTEIIPIRGYEGIYPYYLRLALKSSYFLDYVNSKTYGVKMPRLGTTDGKMAPVPLPPLPEQKRIVAKVESLLAQTAAIKERLIEAEKAQRALNRSALVHLTSAASPAEFRSRWGFIKSNFDLLYSHPENVAELKQTILQLAVQGKLVAQDPNDEPAAVLLEKIKAEKARLVKEGKIAKSDPLPKIRENEIPYELPEGWGWVRWEMLLAFDEGAFRRGPFGSTLKKALFVENGYKVYEQYVPINDDPSFERYYISKGLYDKLSSFHVKAGDYLISCSGTLGRITRIPQEYNEGVINQALLRVRMNHNLICQEYFVHFFRSPFFQQKLFQSSTGSAITNLKGVKELKALLFSLPPINEQKRIVAKLDELLRLCSELESDLKAGRTGHERLVKAVLNA